MKLFNKNKTPGVLFVGCGGVGSLAARIFDSSIYSSVTFMDGDTFEQGNLLRQTFDKGHIGMNKAASMAETYQGKHIPRYITSAFTLPEDINIILCMVDNHAARKACFDVADRYKVPLVVAANEMELSQVYCWYPPLVDELPGYDMFGDPRIWYPDIVNDNSGHTPGTSCSAAIKDNGGGQTFLANSTAAVMAAQVVTRIINTSNSDRQYSYPMWWNVAKGISSQLDTSDLLQARELFNI